jgi:hypothetical protein
LIPACNKVSAIGVSFFRSYSAKKTTIRDVFLALGWDVCFMDEVDGVGAFYAFAYSLC